MEMYINTVYNEARIHRTAIMYKGYGKTPLRSLAFIKHKIIICKSKYICLTVGNLLENKELCGLFSIRCIAVVFMSTLYSFGKTTHDWPNLLHRLSSKIANSREYKCRVKLCKHSIGQARCLGVLPCLRKEFLCQVNREVYHLHWGCL